MTVHRIYCMSVCVYVYKLFLKISLNSSKLMDMCLLQLITTTKSSAEMAADFCFLILFWHLRNLAFCLGIIDASGTHSVE